MDEKQVPSNANPDPSASVAGFGVNEELITNEIDYSSTVDFELSAERGKSVLRGQVRKCFSYFNFIKI